MIGSLNQYLIRIFVFLVLILVVTIFLYPTIQTAFLSNIYINILIIFSLFFGLVFNIYNLSKLNNDFKILEKFNIHKSPKFFLKASPILKSLAQNMSEIDGRHSFKSSSVDKIIERNGIKIMGERNILNKLPTSSSNLYAKNVFNFVSNLYDKENKKININLEDEIIAKTIIK